MESTNNNTSGVEANVNNGLVTVKGKRNINSKVDADITVAIADGVITHRQQTINVTVITRLYRALIANMIKKEAMVINRTELVGVVTALPTKDKC